MHLKTLLIISLLIVLAGCSNNKEWVIPEPVVITEYVTPDCGSPPQRDFVDLRPISWQVINSRFTLSAEGYEDLAYNTSEIWKGVNQLRIEIEYYEQCLKQAKKAKELEP